MAWAEGASRSAIAPALTSGFGWGANTTHQISVSATTFKAMTPNNSSVSRRSGRRGALKVLDGALGTAERDMGHNPA